MTSNFHNYYNQRYCQGYRKSLSGYEYARYCALSDVISKLRLSDDIKILDYGAGNGLFIPLFKDKFPNSTIYCCDISSEGLKQLVLKYPELTDQVALVEEGVAQFNSNSFDLIVSIEVIEHVLDSDCYFSDIHRLLKNNGIFLFTTPCANKFSIEHLYSFITKQIEITSDGFRRWKWEDPGHLRRYTSNEVNNYLENKGFRSIQFRYRSHFFSFLVSKVGNLSEKNFGVWLMKWDYWLFRCLSNGASMIGIAYRKDDK